VRIVAGSARGRPLKGPRDARVIRPTADRVRETLFNVLGQWMDGLAVLDLYAGTGALGLEALSRGAARLVMVDRDREAQGLCRENSAALGFTEKAQLVARPVDEALGQLAAEGERFDLVFADPPYAARAVAELLELLGRHPVCAPGGLLVVEHDRREEAPETGAGFTREDARRFGDTAVSLYRAPA
jgi:16S rRNA (guanine966-N2)-methyltransferase